MADIRSQVGPHRAPFALVSNLQLGNPESEAPASRDGKLELPILNSQAGAWELANTIYTVTDMTELLSERITIDANICHGKPTIRGLRYPVENILEWLSSGMSVDEILADYEDLEREDIMAALEFASRLAKVKRIEMLAA